MSCFYGWRSKAYAMWTSWRWQTVLERAKSRGGFPITFSVSHLGADTTWIRWSTAFHRCPSQAFFNCVSWPSWPGTILAHKSQNGVPSRYVTSECHFYEQFAVKTTLFKTWECALDEIEELLETAILDKLKRKNILQGLENSVAAALVAGISWSESCMICIPDHFDHS
jgi:hypothetical protein